MSYGIAANIRAVSGFRSASSNLVGADPNLDKSNPATISATDPRRSTGSEDPNRAISDSTAIGSTPRARKSRKASVPRRLDSASPCGPVNRE